MHDIQELTAKQRAVYNAFWEAVRDGEECGAKALAEKVGRTTGSVSSNLQSLRSLGVIPTRPAHSREIPEDWRLQVPAEFIDGPRETPTEVPTREERPVEETIALRQQLSEAQRELRAYQRDQGGMQLLVHEIADKIETIPAPKIRYERPKGKRVSKPVALCCHFTDWHLGAVQAADEIEGFNAFSPEILDARMTHFVEDVLEWTALHRSAYTVDECRILVTGDLVSGDIHDELKITNAYPLPVQIVEGGRLLAKVVSLLSPHFDRVVVDLVTVDNHGRLTKKPQHKQGGYNSVNFPLATIAELLLRDHTNVEFNIHPKEQVVVECKTRRYLLLHGHQVRGWAGFPYYGIERKVGKEAAKRMRTEIGRFDRMVLGHFHAPLQHPWYWIGGSASGTDAFDHSNGRESQPIQSAWFAHPVHGEFDRTDWILHEEAT